MQGTVRSLLFLPVMGQEQAQELETVCEVTSA